MILITHDYNICYKLYYNHYSGTNKIISNFHLLDCNGTDDVFCIFINLLVLLFLNIITE